MTAVIETLGNIASAIGSVINFLIDMVLQIIDMVKMVGDAALTIPKLFGIFPPVVTAALLAVLSIAIIYKILGRE